MMTRGFFWREKGTYIANGDVLLARLPEDLGEHTLLLELEIHLGLVGLDLNENLTGLDRVTRLLLPCANIARRHGGREGRHLDDGMRGVRGVPSCEAGEGDTGDAGMAKSLP